MKKLIVLTIALTLAYTSNAQSEFLQIPDANFKNALIAEGVDINTDGEISYTEACGVTKLRITGFDISSLYGIQGFSNLESLNCSDNQITSLDLSYNRKLEELSCSSNQLSNLNVTQNPALTSLDCSHNQLISVDVSHNTKLEGLSCSSNQLSDLDIAQNVALIGLDCSHNQLTNLDVSLNTELAYLACGHNTISGLDLTNNSELWSLSIGAAEISWYQIGSHPEETHANEITSLDLSECTALSFLDCSSNPINNLDLHTNTSLYGVCLCSMNSLEMVCLWDNYQIAYVFDYWAGEDTLSVDITNSPNVQFTSDCSPLSRDDYQENNMAIYPNPASDQLTIEFDTPIAAASITLFDISGKEVYSEIFHNTDRQTHTLNLSSLRKGIYFIRISNDRFSVTEKVIITTHPQPPL